MKANEAPKKLYVDTEDGLSDSILYGFTEKRKDNDIEYIKKDAFVEKVERFLEYKLNDRVEIRVAGTLIPSLTSKIAFVEDFKKYMEGE